MIDKKDFEKYLKNGLLIINDDTYKYIDEDNLEYVLDTYVDIFKLTKFAHIWNPNLSVSDVIRLYNAI